MKTAAYALFLLGTLFFAAPRADGQETLARLETNKLKIYFLGGERFFTIAVTPKAKALEDGAKLAADVFAVESPSRLVLDIAGFDLDRETKIDLKHKFFSTLRLGKHPNKTRVVIDVAGGKKPAYQVTNDPRLSTLFVDISFPEVAAPKPETAVAAAVQDADASQDISETAVEDALEDFADEEPKLVQTLPQSEEAPAPLPQTSPSPAADAAEINEEDLRELVRYGDFPAETFSFPGVQPVHFDVSEAPQSEEFKGGDLPAEETDSRAGEEADWQTAERVPSPPDVSVDFLALEETRKVDALLQREGFSQKEAQTETDNIVQLEQADLAANTEITELPAMAERRDADMLAEGEWDTEEKEASASKTAAVEFGEQDPEQTIVPEPVLTVQQSAQEKPVARANRAQVLQEKLKIVAGKVAAKLDILLAGADAALGKGADKLIVAVRRLKNVNRGTQVVSRAVVPQEKPPAVGSDSISGEQGKHAAEINIKQDVEQIKAAKKPAEKKSAALIQMAGIVEEQNDAVRDAAAGKKARIVKSFAEAGLDNSATAEKIAGDVKAPAGSARSRAAMIDELINEHSFSSDEDAISPNGALVNSRSRKEEMLFGKQRRKPLTQISPMLPVKKTPVITSAAAKSGTTLGSGIVVDGNGVITNTGSDRTAAPAGIAAANAGLGLVKAINFAATKGKPASSVVIEASAIKKYSLVSVNPQQYLLTLDGTALASDSLAAGIEIPGSVVGFTAVVPKQLDGKVVMQIDVEENYKIEAKLAANRLWLKASR